MSNSLWSHVLQHVSLPCPSLSPRVCSNSYPLSHWCHSTISSFFIPFSSRPQSFPASGSLPVSWLFASGGQSSGASASDSVLSMNIQGWLPLGMTGLILLSKGLSNLQHYNSKASILQCSGFLKVQLSQPHVTTGKTIALTIWTFVGQVMSLLFNMLSRFVIAFLPKSKFLVKLGKMKELPGGPVVKIPHFDCRGLGFNPWCCGCDQKKEDYFIKMRQILLRACNLVSGQSLPWAANRMQAVKLACTYPLHSPGVLATVGFIFTVCWISPDSIGCPYTFREARIMLQRLSWHFLQSVMTLKQEGRGKGARHNLWKNDIAWGYNINRLESNGSKMADKSTSTRPWSSLYTPWNTSAS